MFIYSSSYSYCFGNMSVAWEYNESVYSCHVHIKRLVGLTQ